MRRTREGWKKIALASTAVFWLAASPAGADNAEREVWRLFVADHTAPVVRAIDLETGTGLGNFDLKGFAALTASASGRTVFAVQTEADMVQAISTGIAVSDHGEHRDVDIKAPEMLPVSFEGRRPVHAVPHDDRMILFFDREGRADVVGEDALLEGKTDIRAVDATAPHHGVAVTMGRHTLVSVPATKAEVKPDELPPRLGLRVLDESGKQVGDVTPCTALHGEALSARLVAFGCEEGVLLARPGGSAGPKLEMLPYGGALPKSKVTTLLGGKSMQFFLGNFGEDKLVVIDPDAEEPYRLVELPTRRVDFALDPARAKNAYILTEDGDLHLLNVLNGSIVGTVRVTEPYSKDGHWRDPRPRLAVAGDVIAITDPRHSLVRIIDIETFSESRTIPVEGMTFAIVAVGGSGIDH
ncbi:zinc metallochaperone AztD [Neorhizobium petrolearium]|uniref:zinc metallochaperone AztD n=1 Tax=Neorhizobium petrolearium TaxID=515361 RepID=UPI003F81D192